MPSRVIERRKLRKQPIGDMRDRILLQRRTITAPGFNSVGFTQSYETIREVWAKVETNRGQRLFGGVELRENTETRASATHAFSIRWRTDVTEQTRITFNDDLYRIIEVDDTEMRNEYLILFAKLEGDDDLEVNQ